VTNVVVFGLKEKPVILAAFAVDNKNTKLSSGSSANDEIIVRCVHIYIFYCNSVSFYCPWTYSLKTSVKQLIAWVRFDCMEPLMAM
jgi:hypothetical protein